MKAKKFSVVFTTLLLATALVVLSGCGQTYSLQTITLETNATSDSGAFLNLKGIGGTVQFKATGNYTNGKTQDLTRRSTYTVTAEGVGVNGVLSPSSVIINSTGLMTAVDPANCSWHNVGSSTAPAYALSGKYKVVANFDGIDSQPVFVGLASSTGDGPSGACGPE